jgi:hypothetical protein
MERYRNVETPTPPCDRGIVFDEFDMGAFKTVDHVVTSSGIGESAWFKDPDGSTLALFQPE